MKYRYEYISKFWGFYFMLEHSLVFESDSAKSYAREMIDALTRGYKEIFGRDLIDDANELKIKIINEYFSDELEQYKKDMINEMIKEYESLD